MEINQQRTPSRQGQLNVVGESVSGPDDRAKVQGTTVYADDFSMDGLLYGAVVRSTEPSASILSVETDDATALDDVVTVLTAADVPQNEFSPFDFGQSPDIGIHEATSQILAADEVRYVGQPIALVAARTKAAAGQGADLVQVSYERREGVFDPDVAMDEDAPRVNEGSNTIARWTITEGDVERGFDRAQVVVENEYRTPYQEHGHLEPESGVAWVDDEGVINIRVATQVVEQYRTVAAVLDVPESAVRIRGTMIGGGFGGKEDITVEVYLGLLAQATESPVKLTYDREEMFVGRHKRSPFTLRLKHGASADGQLTAMSAELVSDAGGEVDLSPAILLHAIVHSTGPYRIPAIAVDAYSVLTNNTPGSAFRSFGGVEVTIGIEQQMDELARALGMDPLTFRRRNYLREGEVTATGQTVESAVELTQTQAAAWDALGEPTESTDPTVKIGRGIASSWQAYGEPRFHHDTASAWVSVEQDGSAVVRCGIPDLGGGQRESLRTIASEELGVPLERITVLSMDSQLTPLSGMLAATRGLFMSGQAVLKASRTLREQLTTAAVELFDDPVDPADVTICDGSVSSPEQGGSVPLRTVVEHCCDRGRRLDALETFHAPAADRFEGDRIRGDVSADFTFSSQAAEVAVDTTTGVVTVNHLALAHDVGRAINPKRVRGQIEGGALQGLGYALLEQYSLVEGIPQQRGLDSYQLPTTADVPEFTTIVLESESGKGPYGAKGIGEPAITATPAAIFNAIFDAIGVRITDGPADPETVFTALSDAEL